MTALAVGFVHPSTHPLRVLVADDNHDSTDSIAELLQLVGCEVRVCYDGGAILPFAKLFCPDACILDLWMPKLDGWEVARRLRTWADDRMLLLIALTGVSGRQAEEDSLYAGFDHHILKPSGLDVILSTFARFVEKMELLMLELA
jgi:CheY-like chemotaxis protein